MSKKRDIKRARKRKTKFRKVTSQELSAPIECMYGLLAFLDRIGIVE